MKELTLDEILAADDLQITPVDVPEWNGRVYVRLLKADEAVGYSESLSGDEGKTDATAMINELVALCCVDAKGRRLFKDAGQVKGKSFVAVKRIHAEAARVNKLHKGADEEKKDSPEVPAGGSPTA